MTGWDSVSRDDLLRWADSDGAPAVLPQLFRRLVHETGRGVTSVDVAAGSGVSIGGFDGFVQTTEASAFVPVGASGWELSVGKKAPLKAASDFAKRAELPDGSPAADATYVQLIVRPWTKAAQFGRDGTAAARWREVRGYNVDRLANWLEQAPVTRLWFLEQTGRSPMGAWTVSSWWQTWSGATRPALTPAVVLARRGGVTELRDALHRPGLTTVSGPLGLDELLGCIAAATADSEELLLRAVIVEERVPWVRLLAWPSPMVLITRDPSLAALVDSSTPHTVLIPVPQAETAGVTLPAVDTEDLFAALPAVDDEVRFDDAVLARRSFVAFRRRHATHPELMQPSWATAPLPPAVRAALLLTSWNDVETPDRDVVAALAGIPYAQAREQLLGYAHGDDPQIAVVDQRWHLVSPADAWLLLGKHLLADDLSAFVAQASTVLGERDPAMAMPPGERWRASIDGKRLRFSPSLRRGVASGLALLGTYGQATVASTGLLGEQWSARVIRPLLATANVDPTGDLWASLADLLPLLAEAAPRELLDGVGGGVVGPDPVLRSMFRDDSDRDSLFSGGSPHPGLLWALEALAWSADHLGPAAEALAALAALDPGGRLGNRPAASLARIFSAWHPDTAADAAARLTVIDGLRTRWSDVAWPLLISMLPTGHATHFPSHEPDHRDWKPARQPLPRSDYFALIRVVCDRVLADVGVDAGRWKDVLELFGHLPRDLREAVRAHLRGLPVDRLEDTDRLAIWEAGRRLVARHREYSDTKWALPSEELAETEAALAQLRPGAPSDRHAWLFADAHVQLGDLRRRDDLASYDAELAARRTAAVREVVAEGGLESAVQLARRVRPEIVGFALAEAFGNDFIDPALLWLDAEDEPRRVVADAYVWSRCRAGGLQWAVATLDNNPGLNVSVQARILLALDDVIAGRDAARRRGSGVERAYWLNLRYLGRGADFPHVVDVAHQLRAVGRAAAALDMLAMYARSGTVAPEYAEAVAQAMERFIELAGQDAEAQALQQWDFERLFACLDEHEEQLGRSRVARLQWYFLPAFGYDQPSTTALHRALSDDPSFFVEIVSLCYRAAEDDTGARDPHVATNAWLLLESWSTPPGQDAMGVFHADRCAAWIEQATAHLDSAGRSAVGRQLIGQVLTYTPAGAPGWPSGKIADLIENLADDHVDKGVVLTIHNRRGVTTRGLTDGGEQEWRLVAEHRANAQRLRHSHPRVARLFDRVAEGYQEQARKEDREAEHIRRGLDR